MKQRDRIVALLHYASGLSASDIGKICGCWFTPYSTLATLEKEGIVYSDWQFPHSDFPRRRVYALTRL